MTLPQERGLLSCSRRSWVAWRWSALSPRSHPAPQGEITPLEAAPDLAVRCPTTTPSVAERHLLRVSGAA